MSDPRFDRDDEPMPAWRGRSTWAVSIGLHAAAVIGWLLISWLASHGYTQHEGVGPAYDHVRLRILSTIVETTPNGYRESDARFLNYARLKQFGYRCDSYQGA